MQYRYRQTEAEAEAHTQYNIIQNRQRQRERHTDRDREKHTDTQRETEIETETERDRETQRETDKPRETMQDRDRGRGSCMNLSLEAIVIFCRCLLLPIASGNEGQMALQPLPHETRLSGRQRCLVSRRTGSAAHNEHNLQEKAVRRLHKANVRCLHGKRVYMDAHFRLPLPSYLPTTVQPWAYIITPTRQI